MEWRSSPMVNVRLGTPVGGAGVVVASFGSTSSSGKKMRVLCFRAAEPMPAPTPLPGDGAELDVLGVCANRVVVVVVAVAAVLLAGKAECDDGGGAVVEGAEGGEEGLAAPFCGEVLNVALRGEEERGDGSIGTDGFFLVV
jgi:hypothetical protein